MTDPKLYLAFWAVWLAATIVVAAVTSVAIGMLAASCMLILSSAASLIAMALQTSDDQMGESK